MQTKIRAIRTGGSGEEVDLKSSRFGDLRVAQFLPPYAMLCAAGKIFAIDTSGAAVVTANTAMATDSPLWGVYNASTDEHLVLLKVAMTHVSGTAGLGAMITVATGVGGQAAVTGNYTNTDITCLDGTSKTPDLFLDDGPTISGTQVAWVAFGTLDLLANNSVGSGLVADVDGMVIAPPGGSLFIDFISPAGGTSRWDLHCIVAQLLIDSA